MVDPTVARRMAGMEAFAWIWLVIVMAPLAVAIHHRGYVLPVDTGLKTWSTFARNCAYVTGVLLVASAVALAVVHLHNWRFGEALPA